MRPGGLWHRDTRPRRWLITVATEIARILRTLPRAPLLTGVVASPEKFGAGLGWRDRPGGGTGISLDI